MKASIITGFLTSIAVALYLNLSAQEKFQKAITQVGVAQSGHQKELFIGNAVPASLWQKIPKKKTTQLVILDFWDVGCVSCIEAFPKMEMLQHEFNEKVQIVLIDPWETDEQIRSRMNQLNKNRIAGKNSPYTIVSTLPQINGNPVYQQLFPLSTVPHHVWLNNKGIVLYITHGYNATAGHIQKVLDGEHIDMSLKKDLILDGFNAWDGVMRKGNPYVKPAFYSCFTRYSPGYGTGAGTKRDTADGTLLRVYVNNTIINLYKTAFQHGNRTILELNNPEKYTAPEDGDLVDEWEKANMFTYEICVPVGQEKSIPLYMQQDLNRFFEIEKGIEGVLEVRKLNCLILTKIKDGSLRTTGSQPELKWAKDSITWVNEPYQYFINGLVNLEDMNQGKPFLNESGVDPSLRIDMRLSGDLKNIECLRRQLQQYGLDIFESERSVEVLVIRDVPDKVIKDGKP